MRTLLFTTSLFLFFTFSLKTQLVDSLLIPVDTLLNNLEQPLMEYEESLNIAASINTITTKEIQDRGYDSLDELLSIFNLNNQK